MDTQKEYMLILANGLDLLKQADATWQQQVRALQIMSAIALRFAAEIEAENNKIN